MNKKELTMEECEDLLGVSRYRIQQLLNAGRLEPVYYGIPGKKGRYRNITLKSVAKYVKESSSN